MICERDASRPSSALRVPPFAIGGVAPSRALPQLSEIQSGSNVAGDRVHVVLLLRAIGERGFPSLAPPAALDLPCRFWISGAPRARRRHRQHTRGPFRGCRLIGSVPGRRAMAGRRGVKRQMLGGWTASGRRARGLPRFACEGASADRALEFFDHANLGPGSPNGEEA